MIKELNNTLLEGKIVNDPVFKEDPDGKWKLTKFDILNRRRYQLGGNWEEEVLFMPIQVWGEMAEKSYKWLKKGMTARIVGRLRPKKVVSSIDGVERQTIELYAEHLEFRAPIAPKPKEGESVMIFENSESEELDKLSEAVVMYDF